jgi:hypothetical protein
MDRIRLSKQEKKVFRNIALRCSTPPDGISDAMMSDCATVLERMGLIRARWAEGGVFVDGRLTQLGMAYIHQNPHLWNPINWNIITAVATAASAICAVAALFTACSMMKE